MDLPVFRYSPNAYHINVFKEEPGECSICNQARQIKYTASFYSVERPDYICPWCIADGSAAKKYGGEFNFYDDIEGISADPATVVHNSIPAELARQLVERTPSYIAWQARVWLSHCGEPCAFVDYVDWETVEQYETELIADIENLGCGVDFIKANLSKDGRVVGYLFECLQCGTHRLHADD